MNIQDDCAGWFYRQEGQTLGPISTNELRGFLRSGRMQPRQAVWQRQSQGSLFVHAETAAFPSAVCGRQPASDWTPAAECR
jgi:hypothetical protein